MPEDWIEHRNENWLQLLLLSYFIDTSFTVTDINYSVSCYIRLIYRPCGRLLRLLFEFFTNLILNGLRDWFFWNFSLHLKWNLIDVHWDMLHWALVCLHLVDTFHLNVWLSKASGCLTKAEPLNRCDVWLSIVDSWPSSSDACMKWLDTTSFEFLKFHFPSIHRR